MNPLAWGWAQRRRRWASRRLPACSASRTKVACAASSKASDAVACGTYDSDTPAGRSQSSPAVTFASCQLAWKEKFAWSTPSFGVRLACLRTVCHHHPQYFLDRGADAGIECLRVLFPLLEWSGPHVVRRSDNAEAHPQQVHRARVCVCVLCAVCVVCAWCGVCVLCAVCVWCVCVLCVVCVCVCVW